MPGYTAMEGHHGRIDGTFPPSKYHDGAYALPFFTGPASLNKNTNNTAKLRSPPYYSGEGNP